MLSHFALCQMYTEAWGVYKKSVGIIILGPILVLVILMVMVRPLLPTENVVISIKFII